MLRRIFRPVQTLRLISDKPKEAPIHCTVFNAAGKIVAAAQQISRKDLLKANGLHMRDLRHIDGQTALVPRILVHRQVILVNVCDLRVLIKPDKTMIFASKNPQTTERLGMLVYDLASRLVASKASLSRQVYLQTVLETVMVHAIAYLETELIRIRTSLDVLLKDLELQVDNDRLHHLLSWSKELDAFHRKCIAVKDALSDALDDADTFSEMYAISESSKFNQATSVELLLETYHKQADELVQNAGRAAKDVDTTEEIIAMMSGLDRNSLMLFRLEVSIATVACGCAVFFFDLFGMNLENFIDEDWWGLPLVIVSTMGITSLLTWFNIHRFGVAKRVTMAGTAPMDGSRQRHLREWLEMSSKTNR